MKKINRAGVASRVVTKCISTFAYVGGATCVAKENAIASSCVVVTGCIVLQRACPCRRVTYAAPLCLRSGRKPKAGQRKYRGEEKRWNSYSN